MKTKLRRSLSIILSMLMLICCFMPLAVNAENDESSVSASSEAAEDSQDKKGFADNGSMNLDVMFVIDASGSMLQSDPKKVALDAFNLFADMCDETCRVGYVVYTHKIKDSEDLTSINDNENLEKMKKKIEGIVYDPKGDTDIALGLTKAMNTLDESTKEDEYRRRAIVLLSDGNTDLPKGPRTVKESKEEMKKTLALLGEKQIPVYSIGLNYNNSMDKKELSKIAARTEGRDYETKSSDELTGIISDIFGKISQMNGIDCVNEDGNVSIEIKDSSVFYVNVIIRSKLSVNELKPELKDPDGNTVDLENDEDIKFTSTKSYTLIKVMYPKVGVWNLHMEKATKDNCSVKQLNFYSVFVKQELPEDVTIGGVVPITVSINDGKGVINDKDLLNSIEMTTIIETDNNKRAITLKKGSDGYFKGEYPTEAKGVLRIVTTAKSERFQKESDTAFVKVMEMSSGNRVTTEEKEMQDERMATIKKIAFGVIGGVVAIVVLYIIIAFIVHNRRKRLVDSVQHIEEAPKPKAKPMKTVEKKPEPSKQKLVDYEIFEHDALENLVRKGTDDAFQAGNADQYKTDEELEKLIRKGTDDAFKAGNASQYQTNEALEKIVRKGTDDAFQAGNADQYQTNEALEKIVRKGTDDAFQTGTADQYKTDESLEKLVRKGTDDPFHANADDYKVDESLASLIRTGGDGLGVGKEEEHYDDDDNEEE